MPVKRGFSMHHIGPIAGVAAHGPWVATAGYDNRLIAWDSATRTALARFPVSNLECHICLISNGYCELPDSLVFGRYPAEHANHPVFTLSAAAADVYARWPGGEEISDHLAQIHGRYRLAESVA